eukprot:227884-Pleurochrysis_carterae.AAC.2
MIETVVARVVVALAGGRRRREIWRRRSERGRRGDGAGEVHEAALEVARHDPSSRVTAPGTTEHGRTASAAHQPLRRQVLQLRLLRDDALHLRCENGGSSGHRCRAMAWELTRPAGARSSNSEGSREVWCSASG